MNDNTYWALMWKLLTTIAVVAIVSVASCTAIESARVAEAVKNGADPISARCGIVGGWTQPHVCLVIATGKDRRL